MNKTININLSNVFFHIDDEAFSVLDRYLKTIEQYLSKEDSKEEILQDIEARIAELFTASMVHERQVITLSQVEDMIAIMGEPEVYKMDEEDNTTSSSARFSSSKKLYRDIERNYIGGVSAGLHHYLGLNLMVIRLIWIISALFSFGATVAVYIIIWAVTPEARTTAQKLDMQGEPVNISNIERKVKEGYSKFADKVGDIDYNKYSQHTRSGVTKFFDGLGKVLRALGVFISKVLGIILLLFSSLSLLGLIIFVFSFGTISLFNLVEVNNLEMLSLGIPQWIQILLLFLMGAIPIFYLLILSLKLLFSNFKSIGKTTHITLVGIWILCIIIFTTLNIKKEFEDSYDAEIAKVDAFALASKDTLRIKMNTNLLFSDETSQNNLQKIVNDESNDSKVFSTNVDVNIRTTTDKDLKIKVIKKGFGADRDTARENASLVDYNFEMEDSKLQLDNYFLAAPEFLKHNLEVKVVVYIPEDQTIFLDKSLKKFSNIRNFRPSDYHTHLKYYDDIWQRTDSILQIDTLSTQN